jgi:hypothetical protein
VFAVGRATIHHEGAGKPRNGVDLSKYGYSAAVYPDGETIWAPPLASFATRGYNHVSFDVVFTGDRDVYDLTLADMLRAAHLAYRAVKNGWLTRDATTYPHGTLGWRPAGTPPGSSPTMSGDARAREVRSVAVVDRGRATEPVARNA